MAERGKNCTECIAEMDKAFASKPREEWLKLLAVDRDIIVEGVNTIADVVIDPQSISNGYVTDFEHPIWSSIKVVGSPVSFSECEVGPQREAPEFGQHTEEVLMEIAGYSWDDIVRLKDNEVI